MRARSVRSTHDESCSINGRGALAGARRQTDVMAAASPLIAKIPRPTHARRFEDGDRLVAARIRAEESVRAGLPGRAAHGTAAARSAALHQRGAHPTPDQSRGPRGPGGRMNDNALVGTW